MNWLIRLNDSGHSMTAPALPQWSVVPFIGLLLTIGVMSFIASNYTHSRLSHLWEHNSSKLAIAVFWSLPVILLLVSVGAWDALIIGMEEYFAFLVLLFSLFTITGGILLDGDLHAKPRVNVGFLAAGAVLANIVGTTGASMLLIRALLRSNSHRKHTAHIPVFFIFVVSNIGGVLLPIGDPPLFLGYLRGVPFFWTLSLFLPWLVAVGSILAIFYVWDRIAYSHETPEHLREDDLAYRPMTIHGKINFVWLAGVLLAVIFVTPDLLKGFGWDGTPLMFMREFILIGLAGLSFVTSPIKSETRTINHFSFAPIIEVACLFFGIFMAMIPALHMLQQHGANLGITQPWQFFWITGGLSAVLDNAPTYLTFLTVAESLPALASGADTMVPTDGSFVATGYLIAISLGAVFMGAMTYIGNGPNFMVKAIAQEWGYAMPDFFSYTLRYAIPVLLPMYLLIMLLFLL